MNAHSKRACDPAESQAERLWQVSIDLTTILHLAEIAELRADEMHGGTDPREVHRIASLNVAIARMVTEAIADVDSIHAKLKEDGHETHG